MTLKISRFLITKDHLLDHPHDVPPSINQQKPCFRNEFEYFTTQFRLTLFVKNEENLNINSY